MNESVLSIDLSESPSPVVFARKLKGELSVVERVSLNLDGLIRNGLSSGVSNDDSPDLRHLRKIIALADQEYATALIVAPPPSLVSLNLNIPPAKDAERAQAITMLLEDSLPFELDEFLFDWRALKNVGTAGVDGEGGPSSRTGQEHHVAGAPHLFVRQIVESCQALGIEPHVICPPSAALGGALGFIPPSQTTVILLCCSENGLYQLLSHDGLPCYQRFVPHCNPSDTVRISRETVLLSLWAERHLGTPVSAVYTVGAIGSFSIEGIPVRPAPLPEGKRSLAYLAAHAFVQSDRQNLITNLRVGDLSINPLVQRLKQFLPSIIASVVLAILAASCYMGVLYFIREEKITQLQDELLMKVQQLLPSTPIVPGQEVQTLKNENLALNKQLSDLSSAITISPIDALTTVFRDLPESKTLSLTSVELLGKAVRIKGLSPDYSEIEKLENILRKKQTKSKKQIYCRIKKELTSSGRSDKVSFRFELRICNVD